MNFSTVDTAERAPTGQVQVLLKPRKAAPFWGRHPWVLDTAIASLSKQPADGDVVELVSNTGRWIARGIYNSNSRIRVRLYSWNPQETLDEEFWRRRISAAVTLRRSIGYDDPEGACRLIYSEADGLSGLVVDRYGRHLVVQPTSLAMAVRLETLVPLLIEATGTEEVSLRHDDTLTRAEGLTEELAAGLLSQFSSPAEPITIVEHGLRYEVPLDGGQKTGFYLDQRENRLAAARYMRDRRVLDVCCYSGGFSLAAAALGGASEVLGIDTGARAVELATANAGRNQIENVRFESGDCFESLNRMAAAQERFGAVVLDPPRFARGRGGVDDALRAYHRLNRQALEVLEPGGILVTCSCSGSVSREAFFQMLLGVSQKTQRDIRILEARGAAPDHPVGVTCSENEYLKCFICSVGE